MANKASPIDTPAPYEPVDLTMNKNDCPLHVSLVARRLLAGLPLLFAWGMTNTAAAVSPTETQDAIYRALSVRDPVPSCDDLAALTDTPVADLQFVVEKASQPPWAGMRAAQCLVTHHADDAKSTIVGWTTSDNTKGLAIIALNGLDRLPLDVALDVAKSALAGPYAEEAQKRVPKAAAPELKALVP